MKINISKIIGFIIILFSGIYILKSGFFNPIYIAFLIAICMYFLLLISKKSRLVFDINTMLALIYLIYIFLIHINKNIDNALFNVLFSISYFVVSYQILLRIDKIFIKKYTKRMMIFSVALLCIESLYRIMNPVSFNNPTEEFYSYKINSIMYQDSNFVGVFIVYLYFLALYLDNKYNDNNKIIRIFLTILCILTFSRSAIITLLGLTLFIDKRINRILKIFIILFFSFFVGYLIYKYIINDASFISKLYILKNGFNLFFNNFKFGQQLFGIGLGNTKYYLGIGSHNYIITYLLETGTIGLILQLLLLFNLIKTTNKKVLYVLVPFFIMGFSCVPHFIPYIYCGCSIIYSMEKQEQQ